MNKVLLITKLKTTNIGNQALSDELVKLYERSNGLYHVTGRPQGLFGYSLEKLKKQKDPVAEFEKWADNLVKRLQGSNGAAFQSQTRYVELLSFEDFKVKNDGIFQAIKNIFRKFIHTESFFAKTYKKRFSLVESSECVVYSGAGEVGDNNIFLRQLLELRVAQKIGKKTYAINQSVETVQKPMMDVCGHVYKNMDKIFVRGEISKSNMIKMGVAPDIINCCPDSAFLNPTPPTDQIELMRNRYSLDLPAVGINATKVAGDTGKWEEIIKTIKELGYNVYFISNDPFGDKEVGEKIAAQFGVTAILDFIPYPQYAALLANFSFVISCRLHTNELSLTGGTPVLPIEGSHFKTKEVFEFVNYPVPVVNTSTANWPEQIIKSVRAINEDNSSVRTFIDQLNEVRKRSERNLVL